MSEKYRCKYEYSQRFAKPFHVWTVVGQYGAVHFHISDIGEKYAKEYGDRYSGGIEIHYRQPPDYMRNTAPSQDKCWLLLQPCWHDGSSLQASETWVPLWLRNPHDHDKMFQMLSARADEIFDLQPGSGTVLEKVAALNKDKP